MTKLKSYTWITRPDFVRGHCKRNFSVKYVACLLNHTCYINCYKLAIFNVVSFINCQFFKIQASIYLSFVTFTATQQSFIDTHNMKIIIILNKKLLYISNSWLVNCNSLAFLTAFEQLKLFLFQWFKNCLICLFCNLIALKCWELSAVFIADWAF